MDYRMTVRGLGISEGGEINALTGADLLGHGVNGIDLTPSLASLRRTKSQTDSFHPVQAGLLDRLLLSAF